MSAARQAPFAWSNPDNLQEAEPCPALAPLAERLRQERETLGEFGA